MFKCALLDLILIFSVPYQGLDDEFYPNQLLPENFVEACRSKNVPVTLRMHEVSPILNSLVSLLAG